MLAPMELVCLLVGWLVLTAVWGMIVEAILRRRELFDRRGRPILAPHCARCGYCVRGVREFRGPECGVWLRGNDDD